MLVGQTWTKSKLTLLPRLRFKVMSRPANERHYDQVNSGSGKAEKGALVDILQMGSELQFLAKRRTCEL